MIITPTPYAPSYLQGAYNPIVYSVKSDPVTLAEPNFTYVFDIYINDIFAIRLKQKQNPSGHGMIDLSSILQNYLVGTIPETAFDVPTTLMPFTDNGLASLHCFCKVGESYGITPILYDGNGAVGEPSHLLLTATSLEHEDNPPIHVWNSGVEWKLQQLAMANFFQRSGAYTGNIITGKSHDWSDAIANGVLAYPLSHAPLTQSVYLEDRFVLSYIFWSVWKAQSNPSPADNNFRFISFFRIEYFDAQGMLISSIDQPVDASSGMNFRTDCNEVIATKLEERFDIIHVDSSILSLSSMLGFVTPTVGESLTIQGFQSDLINPCNIGVPVTEISKIVVLDECANPLYDRTRLSWLNDLGGRDYMNFTMFLEKEITTENDSFYQNELALNGEFPVPINLNNDANPNFDLSTRGGNKVYNKIANTSWTIQTDWLNQDEVILLEGLQKSPQVLAYIQDGFYNQYAPYSVTITQKSYKTKNVRQVKLIQGEFTISLSQNQKMQNIF